MGYYLIMAIRHLRREAVNHPLHYGGDVQHETYKCLRAWGLEEDALLWNAAKYLSRAGKKKDKIEDLEKAIWYIRCRIEQLKSEGKSEDRNAVCDSHGTGDLVRGASKN